MTRPRTAAGLLALGLVALVVGTARADRVPSQKAYNPPVTTGTRPDIFVPYVTNGTTTLGAWRVAPIIYSSPIVSDPANPGARPVFNLPFYGARQAFGDRSNGAVSVPGAIPLPNR
jgi:hypothetical protein